MQHWKSCYKQWQKCYLNSSRHCHINQRTLIRKPPVAAVRLVKAFLVRSTMQFERNCSYYMCLWHAVSSLCSTYGDRWHTCNYTGSRKTTHLCTSTHITINKLYIDAFIFIIYKKYTHIVICKYENIYAAGLCLNIRRHIAYTSWLRVSWYT